mgnify:CR=1 FL=1
MTKLSLTEIGALPEYKDLLAKRRAIAVPLCLLVLVAYCAFILTVGYRPDIMSIRLADGVTSVGIVSGLGIILLTLGVTVVYVSYANSRIEKIVTAIQKKASGEA